MKENLSHFYSLMNAVLIEEKYKAGMTTDSIEYLDMRDNTNLVTIRKNNDGLTSSDIQRVLTGEAFGIPDYMGLSGMHLVYGPSEQDQILGDYTPARVINDPSELKSRNMV
ncbi:MAG: hypothetical protein ACTSQX_16385 [Candidatus Heimdallarchaeota archaeon]